MIKQIDIQNFGSFRDFVWNTSLRDDGNNVVKFKKLNILYGRNYSGKTTLSRIVRSLETGELPVKYKSPSFAVTTNVGIIDNSEIPDTDHHIRVYNKDFVDNHLGFLRDEEGDITPFAIIGSENNLIEKEISNNEGKLGSVDDKSGLRYEHSLKHADFVEKQTSKNKAETKLAEKLTNKANLPPSGIKHNTIYKDPNYNTRKIKTDIETIRNKSLEPLNIEELETKKSLLEETHLPDIKTTVQFSSNLLSLYETAEKLCSKKITPTKPVQELLNDAILQKWVKDGISHHKDKRDNCGFCGQALPANLWNTLDEHFSKESSELENSLNSHIDSIKIELDYLENVLTINEKQLYKTFHSAFQQQKINLEKELKIYQASLNNIVLALERRSSDIFKPITIKPLENNTDKIFSDISLINTLIENNNKKTESLEEDQNIARVDLRLSEICQFMQDINLSGEEENITQQETHANSLKAEVEALHTEIRSIERKIEELKVKLKDERKGAEKVNEYLNHFFGHKGLHLEAIEDEESSRFKFQVLRGETPAYNLSEGECSLVAFCYFMAKLEDTESKNKKLIIYIDDPISSLDGNHIFFIYSLIESLIARPKTDSSGNVIKDDNDRPIFEYEQLFISTHNLEFLKYLKKLSRPRKDHEQFLIIGKDDSSVLELMPNYLRNYITEFNYLFGEVYTCSNALNAAKNYHCFYNFGNNLRKFLEAFLFFKYPFSTSDRSDYDQRIQHFFQDDGSSAPLIQRLTNEYSHLGEVFDRGAQPIDCDEISKVARFVLKKIKDNDTDQYTHLLQSINKSDPFEVDQVAFAG